MKDFIAFDAPRPVRLKRIPTRPKPNYASEPDYLKRLGEYREEIAEFQTRLYASRDRAALIIFQGMDTAGKDGAIRHVMAGVNPQGCSVVSFKTPTSTELEHDFLWKANMELPARGQIGIFNRSYYEEALITRVHPELLEKERLPRGTPRGDDFWRFRYRDIVNHEKFLHRQGYEIIKIFIHISKEEQRQRLLSRFSDPKKLWKISEGDLTERAYWDEYQAAYEKCIRHTASRGSPWYVVPGDDKKFARLAISQILVDRFAALKLQYPRVGPSELKKLKKMKAQLKA